ncbi:hypothetical protein K2173_028042 [Erythroxylum novogranatense]|uniref:Uncharacterized protein n=1 Tax=Erythroxylum novogranatense TaxID=1862640 RepID=A0AAV8U3C6_9ROSI|nr:hypothetical protein K2173_028042 [Erythroxylum novogranatense]
MAAPNSLVSPQIALMDKIKATHLSGIPRELDVTPLLLIVENIFYPTVQVDVTHTAVQSELSFLIERVSCEISYKALSRVDSETTALTIFNMIGTYDWDVKLVLSLAAFALNYGSFLLVNRTHSTNELAESIAKLRGLPNLSGNETLNKLINSMVKLAKCVLEFQRLPRVYISAEFQAFANALEQIKFAAYMTVKSIVTCSIYISSIMSFVATQSTVLGHGFQFLEADLSGCTQQLITTYESLNRHLVECNTHIETSKNDKFYQQLVMYFGQTTQSYSTITLLTNLLCANDNDRRPLDLIQCSSSVSVATTVSINELNLVGKNVLLFFSSVEISKVEITNIISVYEKHKAACEIVWIPIVEQWTEVAVSKFNSLQALMPWYTICKPELLHTVVVKFVKNKWQFGSKPMLVVLDHKGKLSCSDAFHMVQIWGVDAFPFTNSRQKELWMQQTWKLDILIQSVQTNQSIIWNWIANKKLIFLCGGNNMNEVMEIIQSAVSKNPELAIVCVSSSFTEQQFSSFMYQITEKQDGYCLIDEGQWQLFKLRLESMLFSKIQVGVTAETDPILFGIQKLLSYSETTEWAMLSQGSEIKVCGLGSLVKQTFLQFSQWQAQATHDFAAAFVGYYQEHRKFQLPPCRMEFPPCGPYIPSQLLCPECNCIMKRNITFSCYHPTYHVTSTTSTTTNVVTSVTSVATSSATATATKIGASSLTSAGVFDKSRIAATNTGGKEIGSATSIGDTSTGTATTIGASGLISAGVLDKSSIAATKLGAMEIGSVASIVDTWRAAATSIGTSGHVSAGVLDTSSNAASNIAISGDSNDAFVESSTIEEYP